MDRRHHLFSKNAERLQLFDDPDEIFRDENGLVVVEGHEFPFRRIEGLQGKALGYLAGASVGGEFEGGRWDILIADVDHAGSSDGSSRSHFAQVQTNRG